VQAFVQAASILSGNVDLGLVRQLISAGFDAILGSLDQPSFVQALQPMVDALSSEVVAGGTAAHSEFPDSVRASYSFDKVDPRAVAWAQTRSGELIAQLTDEQRAVVRDVLARSVENGSTAVQTANDLKSVIGLNDKWAQAVANTRAKEYARLIKQGVSPAIAETQANAAALRHRETLIKARATNIARTEIQTAQNQGRYLSWAQGIEGGYIAPTAQKRWQTGPLVTAGPNRVQVCPVCAPLAGEVKAWSEPFSNGVLMPPAHPSCRCTAVLVPKSIDQVKALLSNEGWEKGGVFAGERCAICPGNCTRRVAGDTVKSAAACSGLPNSAPPNAVPVKKAAEIAAGDTFYLAGQKDGYKVYDSNATTGKVTLEGAGGKPIVFDVDGSSKKMAVVNGPAKATKAAEDWKKAVDPKAKPVVHAPASAKPITKMEDCHPGDTLYFSTDKTKTGWSVVAQDKAQGKVLVAHPDTGKKYLLDVTSGAKKSGYAINPGPDKGKHLLNVGTHAGKPPVTVTNQTGTPPPQTWTPKAGAITGHAKYPGNTYQVVSVGKMKVEIKTAAGTKFEADPADLIGLHPGMKVGSINSLGTNALETIHKIEQDKNGKTIVYFHGKTQGKPVDLLQPGTATPGQGAALGAGGKTPPKYKPATSAPSSAGLPAPAKSYPPAKGSAAKPGGHPKGKKDDVYDFTGKDQDKTGQRTIDADFEDWRKSLTTQERDALRKYTGSWYARWNNDLRHGDPETPEIKAARQALERAIIPRDLIVSRGMSQVPRSWMGASPGTVIHDPAFLSTAAQSTGFGGDVQLRIFIPKGSKGAYLGAGDHSAFGHSEAEVLLPPGTTMRILSKSNRGGTEVWDVEVIAQGNPPPGAVSV
jgi:hypothetical protein